MLRIIAIPYTVGLEILSCWEFAQAIDWYSKLSFPKHNAQMYVTQNSITFFDIVRSVPVVIRYSGSESSEHHYYWLSPTEFIKIQVEKIVLTLG